MLGAQMLSLYGRDTQHAFGHLGFTNMLAWADPQRALACAVMTNGKPVLYPELPSLLRPDAAHHQRGTEGGTGRRWPSGIPSRDDREAVNDPPI